VLDECISRASILVADDSKINVQLMVRTLAKLGCTKIKTASNGLEVLAACALERPDLILLDCQMPLMVGSLSLISDCAHNSLHIGWLRSC